MLTSSYISILLDFLHVRMVNCGYQVEMFRATYALLCVAFLHCTGPSYVYAPPHRSKTF